MPSYLESSVFAGVGVCVSSCDSAAVCACGVLAGLPPKNVCLEYKGILNSIAFFLKMFFLPQALHEWNCTRNVRTLRLNINANQLP